MLRSIGAWAIGIALLAAAMAVNAQTQRIDITQFCNDPGATDHTACISAWINAGRGEPEKTLFASTGVYYYSGSVDPYSRMRLECAGPLQTTFKAIPDALGRWPPALIRATEPVSRVRIDNCGFDLKGNSDEYAAAIDISPDMPRRSTDIRVRGNRIFDSTHPGQTSAKQRQYIVLINCENCRVEYNHLSEGGRIKLGRPGRNLRISGNIVEHANDNAITVADWTVDGVSRNIRIENNRVLKPVGIGIFFGADGDGQGSPSLTTRQVSVQGNYIEGDWKLACVFGRLPYIGSDVYVRNNTCVKTGPAINGVTGIRIKRTCGATLPASDIYVEGNSLRTDSATGGAYDHGGIAYSGIHSRVRVRWNNIRNAAGGRAMVFNHVQIADARIEANELNGGSFQIIGSVQGTVQTANVQPNTGPIPEPCHPLLQGVRPGGGTGPGTSGTAPSGTRPDSGAGPGTAGSPPAGTR